MNEQLLTEFRAFRTVLRNKESTRAEIQACMDRLQELRKVYSWDEIYDVTEFVATELENSNNE